MLKGSYVKYSLDFKNPSGTSRGILTSKDSYFLKIWDDADAKVFGLGEISIIVGLSIDNPCKIEAKIVWLLQNLNLPKAELMAALLDFPAIRMGLETAYLDLKNGGQRTWFSNPFTKGQSTININGLIWMGDADFMLEQISNKLATGFSCLKLKIGAFHFEEEVAVIQTIRAKYNAHDLEIRVDANGAFAPDNALQKLKKLADLDIHSIEQPIQQGQWNEMQDLCAITPLPIALDEELIGIQNPKQMVAMLEQINPQYIILKPSLVGGFTATMQWIAAAGELSIPWWITSALESNIGLAAIAQFTANFYNPLPQGLGTGQIYTNNIPSPLFLKGQELGYNPAHNWNIDALKF